jgi:hypothetical protein
MLCHGSSRVVATGGLCQYDLAQLAMQMHHLHQRANHKQHYQAQLQQREQRLSHDSRPAEGDQLKHRVSSVIQAAEAHAFKRPEALLPSSHLSQLAFVHKHHVCHADVAQSTMSASSLSRLQRWSSFLASPACSPACSLRIALLASFTSRSASSLALRVSSCLLSCLCVTDVELLIASLLCRNFYT